MQINEQEIEPCKSKILYSADPETVIEKRKEALKQLKNLPISGFRKGKAPDNIIKIKHKGRIDQWLKQELINHAFDDILFETKIKPIGQPNVSEIRLENNNFSCEMVIMKKPSFELLPVKGLEIPKPHSEITATDLAQKMLQELRVRNGDATPFQDSDIIQVNDVVTMDVQINDNIEEGKLHTTETTEFDNNILGMKAGETKEFTIEDQTYKVTVHMGMKQIPCALDDSLAQKLNLKTYDELLNAVQGMATSRLQQLENNEISEQIIKRLVEMHKFEIPQWLLNMEIQEIALRNKINLNEITEEQKLKLNEQALNSVKFALILDSIRQEEPESELTEAEAINLLKQELIRRGDVNPDQSLQGYQKSGQLFGFVASIKNQYALKWLVDNAKLVE